MKNRYAFYLFTILVFASLAGTVVYTQDLLYPFVSVKALVLRMVVFVNLPLYVYLLAADKQLRPSWKNPVTVSVVAFFVANVISTIAGVNSSRSWWGNYERMGGTYHLLHLTLLYLYVVTLGKSSTAALRAFLQTIMWAGSLTALYGVLTALGLPRIFFDPSFPRVSVTTGNPIFFASFLVLPLFLALFFSAEAETSNRRFVYALAAFVQLAGVFVTATRGAVVGVGVAMVAAIPFVLWKADRKRIFAGYGVLCLVLAGLIGLYALRSHIPSTSIFRRIVTLQDSNTEARLIQWKTALRGFKDRPVFGFGPENYNVAANKYFDPSLYKYDASWFDKPHNYLLEILVTTGAVGEVLYLAITVFSFWLLWRAYVDGFVSWAGFLWLTAGITAYQIQNIFVFDTVPAAIVFFGFTGFVGYLHEALGQQEPQKQKRRKHWPLWLAGVCGAAALYVVLVTDVGTWNVIRYINYGYAIDVSNAPQAKGYFDEAASQPFVYDRGEIGTKYQTFAIKIAQDMPDKFDRQFVNDTLDGATRQLELVTKSVSNNPVYWFDLGNLYSVKAYYNKQPEDPRAEAVIQKAISLAPARLEPYYFLIQIRALQHDVPGAVAIGQQLVARVPESAEAKWRLALAYKDNHQDELAAQEAEAALAQGYDWKLVTEFRWLINYYVDKQDYGRVVQLYEKAVELNSTDFQLWANLASAYAKTGQKDKAIAAARRVQQLSPESAAAAQSFIDGLQ